MSSHRQLRLTEKTHQQSTAAFTQHFLTNIAKRGHSFMDLSGETRE